ncbi:hypothetical protein BTJ39_24195 [Izhakiella australiensis]|uniref:DUF6862 domain-containing protein n=1 Tax=Izhakiella australiensis TaxID=1926881 RepID=A0A1S8Y3W7_9GAMM|nr:hypothetical protein [Izhakiella australiensis]OON33526.1 hypothetical protein BTJ39_24195 [Izhakiella australiensis]
MTVRLDHVVENNWLHADEKSALEAARAKLNSQDPAERAKARAEEKQLVALSVERDKDVISACSGTLAGSDACKQKRAEAVLALMGYEDGPYNSKYKNAYPDEYLHIGEILDQTSQKTQDQRLVRDAVAQSLAKRDEIPLSEAYRKYDRYTATRDFIGIVGGAVGGIAMAERIPIKGKASGKAPAYIEEPPFNPSGTNGDLTHH